MSAIADTSVESINNNKKVSYCRFNAGVHEVVSCTPIFLLICLKTLDLGILSRKIML